MKYHFKVGIRSPKPLSPKLEALDVRVLLYHLEIAAAGQVLIGVGYGHAPAENGFHLSVKKVP